ncbi:hypothetical protein PoB_005100500 [Plakobranchus ocellatus]|uniref:PiggyBac transposable element-derived protein domain-containing protein n=1 Tax=Plakobranchus ocellatus TaxID=259542 RepID=A0AAV4BYV6_9GAST|nr:hypothetical protein PoB_005100500 [Plakobranchus ocellatus]
MDSDSNDCDFLSDDDPDYDQLGSETEYDQTPDASGSDIESSSSFRSTHQAAGDGGHGMSVHSNNADWNKDDVRPNFLHLQLQKVYKCPLSQGSKALEFFNLFAHDDFFNLLVTEINQFCILTRLD